MKCSKCDKKAIINNPYYCKDHFTQELESKVKKTIKQFNLIGKNDKVLVATSGGKDSLTVLYVLKKVGYKVDGLLIDEGIDNYRDYSIEDMKEFAKKNHINLIIKSFKEEYGYTLDEMKRKLDLNPCNPCGIFRRQLLNKYSTKYDVIATGHNLDDEAQSIMMNLLKAQTQLLSRIGPITGLKKDKKFTKRIKPLYFIPEKHIKIYTILNGIKTTFVECPYTYDSFRNEVQENLNQLEEKHPGAKLNIVNHFLKNQEKIKQIHQIKEKVNACDKCNQPSSGKICNACKLLKKLKNNLI